MKGGQKNDNYLTNTFWGRGQKIHQIPILYTGGPLSSGALYTRKLGQTLATCKVLYLAKGWVGAKIFKKFLIPHIRPPVVISTQVCEDVLA